MAASTALRQTALSLDAAFMEDAVPVMPVATTRRRSGRNLAALLIVSAIGSLALGSALAPSADAPSLRGHAIQLQNLDGAAARSFDGLRRRLASRRRSILEGRVAPRRPELAPLVVRGEHRQLDSLPTSR